MEQAQLEGETLVAVEQAPDHAVQTTEGPGTSEDRYTIDSWVVANSLFDLRADDYTIGDIARMYSADPYNWEIAYTGRPTSDDHPSQSSC